MDTLINPPRKCNGQYWGRNTEMLNGNCLYIHYSLLALVYMGPNETRFPNTLILCHPDPESSLPVLLQWCTHCMVTQGMSPLNFFWGKYSLSLSLSVAFLFILFVPFSLCSFFPSFSHCLRSLCIFFLIYISAVCVCLSPSPSLGMSIKVIHFLNCSKQTCLYNTLFSVFLAALANIFPLKTT